jgi:hypothetical protein
MSLKCTRNLTKYIPDMSPRETRPTTKLIRAQNKWRTSPKSNQTNSTLRNTTMGQVQEITRDNPTKLDSRWPT